jgi:hypothetical protein
VTQDECPAGRVLMRGKGVGFSRRRRCRGGRWKRIERIACRSVSRERSLGHSARPTYLKTSPNLSATRIVSPECVNPICVGFLGSSLYVKFSRGKKSW